jgi:pimeloyl-ACP methyl ester carboxylesterase
MVLDVSLRHRLSPIVDGWQILASNDGQGVETDYEFLRWDDIVRKHWPRNELHILRELGFGLWTYFSSGALWRVLRTSWPPFITGLIPTFFVTLVYGVALAAGLAGNAIFQKLAGGPGWLGYVLGVSIFAGVVQGGRLLEKRINCHWLLRIYAFTARQGLGRLPDLEARLDAFAERIVSYMRESKDDEVLIVGHSTGTIMAISVVARALALDPRFADGKQVSLLTVGGCIPMLSLLPQAKAFRDQLAAVASASDIDWVDFTAPTDGACFALVDPVEASGLPQADDDHARPKLLSTRFVQLFTPQTYRKIRHDWYRMHFQYLMAGELAGDYDYFAITAGPLSLSRRYGAFRPVRNFDKFKVFK